MGNNVDWWVHEFTTREITGITIARDLQMIPQVVRETLFPRLDPFTRTYADRYLAYQLHPREYLGAANGTAVRDWLEDHGYSYNGLAAAKRHPEDRTWIDSGSYRKVPAEHPDVSGYAGGDARLVTEWDPEECQYHVHVFDPPSGGEAELLGHYEVRPDLLAPSVSVERLRVHYRPTWHEDYLPGVASEGVRNYVE